MHNISPILAIDYCSSTPLNDLIIAQELISRNTKLLKDFPSLEDALKLLNDVIMMQQD